MLLRFGLRCLACMLLGLALLSPHRVSAQPAPPALEPPKLRSEVPVPYPPGGTGEQEVVLRLRIGVDGRVEEATVLQGEEPFASAALAAIRSFTFDPATREGKPVPAFIRFLLRFAPPAPPPPSSEPRPVASSSAPAPTGTTPVPPAAPRVEAEEEVTVLGTRTAPGVSSLTRAEVRQLPGAFGDPFRAIEALPGVTPLVSGAPFFYVRGAPPGNVGYFLDGVRVPYLFHVFLGPSVVNPAMVQQVDLYPGGYPARLGRFSGGVVAGETTPPVAEFHGEAVLRLLDVGAMAEAPFAGGRGTALVGGRYSYTALLLSLLAPDARLEYWDYQARVSYRVSPTATVSVFSFGARDFLGSRREETTRALFDTQFHRVDLRYDEALRNGGTTRLAATLGLDRTGGGDAALQSRSVRVRSETTWPLGAAAATFGADFLVEGFDNQLGKDDEEPPDAAEVSQRQILTTRQDFSSGVHGEVAWPLGPVVFTPGMRVDLYASSDNTQPLLPGVGAYVPPTRGRIADLAVEPRLSVRAALSRRVRTVHTMGVAHQPPSFVVPLPGFQPSPLRGGLQRSLQASAGVEVDLGAGITGTTTVFRSLFTNLSDALGTRPVDEGGPDLFESRADGTAMGLEVLLRRSLTRRLGGFVAYTLSRSDRRVTLPGGRRSVSPANFDRTHVLNAALAYDLGRSWRAGGRLVFYTGIPSLDAGGATLAQRARSFHRIDLRLERSWRLGERSKVSLVFEFLNATLRTESLSRECDEGGCRDDEFGPVFVPSIGGEAVF